MVATSARSRRASRRTGIGTLALVTLLASCGQADGSADASTPPTCEEITRFAERFVDIGFDYDYEPSQSPAQLAAWTDVVVGGVLTGRVEHGSREWGDPVIAYGVEVTEVIKGADHVAVGDEVFIGIDYSDHHVAADELEDAIAVGAPAVAFAFDTDAGPWFTASVVEGLMTACDDARPIGWVGDYGTWPEIGSLDEVLEQAAGP